MTTPIPAAGTLPEAAELLEALAAELTRQGWTAQLHAPPGRIPSLSVTNPAATVLSDHVIAAPARDGTWCYWWSWAQRIAPAAAPTRAAKMIIRVLRTADQP
jgi:hypothetical protein